MATQWAALQGGCTRMRADAYTALAHAAHEGHKLALGTYTAASEWTGQATAATVTTAHKAFDDLVLYAGNSLAMVRTEMADEVGARARECT